MNRNQQTELGAIDSFGSSAPIRYFHVRALLLPMLAYTCIAVAIFRPLLHRFGSALAGDQLDPWQTVWGIWWWHQAVAQGVTPLWCPIIWWPSGQSLWLQTWDLPSIAITWPLWHALSPQAVYNTAVFLSFPLSGAAAYLLVRRLWNSITPALLSGALYSFSTYHYGHAGATLHMASMEWGPLYFYGIVDIAEGKRRGPAIVAGALALSLFTSPYYFVFCLIGSGILSLIRPSAFGLTSAIGLRAWAVAAGLFLILAGWWLWGQAGAISSNGYIGAHQATEFSADLESFVVPNQINAAVHPWSRTWRASRWHGATALWANAVYPGYSMVLLAALGFWAERRSRPYVWMALAAGVLSLGPVLQIGGITYPLMLPYGWVVSIFPVLEMGGVPSRYWWLGLLGLTVASGAGLRYLWENSRAGRVVAVIAVVVGLAETWPRPLEVTSFPVIQGVSRWATDHRRWAVVDATGWSRMLWNQMHHGHPIIAGYSTRVTVAARNEVIDDPVLLTLLKPLFPAIPSVPRPSAELVVSRLRDLTVRFVIAPRERRDELAALGLMAVWSEGDVVVFEVPDS